MKTQLNRRQFLQTTVGASLGAALASPAIETAVAADRTCEELERLFESDDPTLVRLAVDVMRPPLPPIAFLQPGIRGNQPNASWFEAHVAEWKSRQRATRETWRITSQNPLMEHRRRSWKQKNGSTRE